MMYLVYKIFRKIYKYWLFYFSYLKTCILFRVNRIRHSTFSTYGTPFIHVANHSVGIFIGDNFRMNNVSIDNPIGIYGRCQFVVHPKAEIRIGKNVGISQSALVSHCSIVIGDNVDIGGGTLIYTSDFHSLDYKIRMSKDDQKCKVNSPVIIEDNVFIGARSIILKGVTIGRNSIVGAGSVVTKSIPSNQIWGGNPAKFIRNI